MWMAPKLNRRIQVLKSVQTENSITGNLDISYQKLSTIWSEIKPVSAYIRAIRGEQTEQGATHKFTVRRSAIINLGISYDFGFSGGFKNMADLNQIKSDMFLFMEQESNVKGILFRVVGIERDDIHKEFLIIMAQEIEEHGTGAGE